MTVPLLLLAVNGSQVRLLMAAAALSPTTVAVARDERERKGLAAGVDPHTPDAAAVVAKINFLSQSPRWLPGQHNQTSLTLLFRRKKRAIRCAGCLRPRR